MADDMVRVQVELPRERAAALALFLKRLMLSDFEAHCGAHEKADALHYTMQSAAFDLANALAEAGFDPR